MKNLILNIILIVSLLIYVSCDNETRSSEKTNVNRLYLIENALLNYIMNDSIEQAFVIPNEGCGGCISNATNYVYNNIDTLSNSIIIFTKVRDKKLLKNQLGDTFLSRKNVFIDKKNFASIDLNTIYPKIYTLKNRKVVDENTIDVENLK
jgi:hypothetical protein